jgi:L-fucose/D-arabinose isomerase
MGRVAIVTVSDGRPGVYAGLEDFALGSQARLARALRSRGHTVQEAAAIVGSNEAAVNAGRVGAAGRPDLTIVNIPVWSFPNFTMLVAGATIGPLALFSNVDPAYPGMVGMLAAGGALDQIGRVHARAWGDVEEAATLDRLDELVRAGHAAARLSGSTFGRIGGRPMGMNTAVAPTDQWLREFGIDVEEIDQLELVRRAGLVEEERVRGARDWLERTVAAVHYDGRQLTEELLERQIRLYHAMRELIAERHLDFCGIKAQPELTDHFCTADIAEAFLNDPYDWEGAKPVTVCATEADMDGALTMLVLHSLSGTPALFADMRHYHQELEVWDLCNSGQHATWFAARSDDAAENLDRVHLYPQGFYFPAGGAAVHHLAAPGEMTFARMSRLDGAYRMQVLSGELRRHDAQTDERLMRASTYEWPHAFAHFSASPEEILGRYGSNHIHAVPGQHTRALRDVCAFLGIAFDGFAARQ